MHRNVRSHAVLPFAIVKLPYPCSMRILKEVFDGLGVQRESTRKWSTRKPTCRSFLGNLGVKEE